MNITPEDLKRFSHLKALYAQAGKAGWVCPSEANFLNWIASAVRATSTETRDPVRVFVSIVKGRRWELITQAQEERARVAITRHRETAQIDEARRFIPTRLASTSLTRRID